MRKVESSSHRDRYVPGNWERDRLINPGMVDTYFANSTQGLPEKKDWLKVEQIAEAVACMASSSSSYGD
ncbi:hypothetical protein SAMN05877753_103326 [Bacillus oleivorans]|uniref:Uncharacterized protein n=1 Tax=Bacillus oleivorans TaxID=1448271 RepID=A0A285CR27_9BACI|nr:hypothetical protein SAMN05877753_103326 [Bacillus oleivorans]